LGDMQAKLLAKVEELTLHMIQAEERNDRLEQRNRELQERIAKLEGTSAATANPPVADEINQGAAGSGKHPE